jgi:hypothetical protein
MQRQANIEQLKASWDELQKSRDQWCAFASKAYNFGRHLGLSARSA